MRDDSWNGRTYYGRPQLKPAPFDDALVGTYVFLAGLSGAAQLLSALIDAKHGGRAAGAVRRGRYLSLLAPTLGSVCLILDLHTPRRFYNMLRLYKATSPMSFGSWALVGFSGASALTAALQFLSDRGRWLGWLRSVARVTQIPAAVLGSVLGTYTASLFSATSTPRWAASPRGLAIRFGSASVASAAAAMSLAEGRHSGLGRDLDGLAIAALAVELAASLGTDAAEQRMNLGGEPGRDFKNATIAVPLGLFALSLLWPRHRSRTLSAMASLGVLANSLEMRIEVLRQGKASARRPELSLGFAQPDNLPAMDVQRKTWRSARPG